MEQNGSIPSIFRNNSSGELPQSEIELSTARATVHVPHDASTAEVAKAFSRVEFEPGDVDSFLEYYSPLMMLSETSWHSLQDSIEYASSKIDGHYLGLDSITKEPRMSRSPLLLSNAVTHENVGTEFALELARNARAQLTMEDIREIATAIGNQDELDDYDPVAYVAASGERKSHQSVIREGQNELLNPDDMSSRSITHVTTKIMNEYRLGFGAQQLLGDRIATFLQDDANVGPFVSRIKETIELRRQGINEFPGLLEGLNTMISQQQIESGSSALELAIQRTSLFTEPLDVFTRQALTDPNHRVSGNAPKEFPKLLEGVKLTFDALTADGGMSEHDFLELFSARISSVEGGGVWRRAHSADADAKTRTEWRHLYKEIRKYERRGRIPDALSTLQQQPTAKKRLGNKWSAKSTVLSGAEVSDLVTPVEEFFMSPVLAILKNRGSSEFGLHRVEDIEELMEHSVILNFLRQLDKPDQVGPQLKKSIELIAAMPTNPLTTRIIKKESFSVDDPDCASDKRHRLRRFRPTAQLVDFRNPQTRRLRVMFGIVPSKVGSILAIQSLTLREKDTY